MSARQRLVWLVVYGNYFPPEVIAVYGNEPAAREHAANDPADDDGVFEVLAWTVRSRYEPETP